MGFLAWVALVPLLIAIERAHRPRRAFAIGYLFGMLHWGAIITWIGSTVANWSHSPLGWIAWFILTAIKSLWFGLFGVFAWWVFRRSTGWRRIIGLAAAWTLVEWFRGQTAVAMPWALIGYTQYRYLPLIQASDLFGVYGVSLAIAVVNATLAVFQSSNVAIRHSERSEESAFASGEATTESKSRFLGSLGMTSLHGIPRLVMGVVLPPLVLLSYGVGTMNRSEAGPPIHLALMQPNMRSERGAPQRYEKDMELLREMTLAAAAGKPQMIIFPETITPEDAISDNLTRETIGRLARQAGAYSLVGTGYIDDEKRLHNSAALFAPDGRLTGRYDKHWLVPMGEWVPLRAWLPFGDVFHFPEQDVVPGASNSNLRAGPADMCVLICYESVFPVLSRARVAAGANILVSITNDSWAGESPALQQHFAMGVFRAVETRRWFVASATTGLTGYVSPSGTYRYIAPYEKSSLAVDPQLLNGKTFYVRFGDWLIAVCGLLLAASLFARADRREGER